MIILALVEVRRFQSYTVETPPPPASSLFRCALHQRRQRLMGGARRVGCRYLLVVVLGVGSTGCGAAGGGAARQSHRASWRGNCPRIISRILCVGAQIALCVYLQWRLALLTRAPRDSELNIINMASTCTSAACHYKPHPRAALDICRDSAPRGMFARQEMRCIDSSIGEKQRAVAVYSNVDPAETRALFVRWPTDEYCTYIRC
jgi:hypothetical protein